MTNKRLAVKSAAGHQRADRIEASCPATDGYMLACGGGNPRDGSVAYRDLLDLPGVGDDLLHHLHGLALALNSWL